MALTPEEENAFKALSEKAAVVDKPSGIKDILHAIISHLGSGPVHDGLHEAVDDLASKNPPSLAPSPEPEPPAPSDTKEGE